MKLVNLTLQLVDRSVIHKYDIIEDVLVNVSDFYYHVDFIVQTLAFENLTAKVNVFNLMRQQDDLSMVKYVRMIDNPVSYFHESFPIYPLTPLLNLSTINIALSPPSTNDSYYSLSDLSSPIRSHSICNIVFTPQLKLKQLPSDLKYIFLDFESQFLVIIASNLSPQQDKLGVLLRNHIFATGWSFDDVYDISPYTCTHHIQH